MLLRSWKPPWGWGRPRPKILLLFNLARGGAPLAIWRGIQKERNISPPDLDLSALQAGSDSPAPSCCGIGRETRWNHEVEPSGAAASSSFSFLPPQVVVGELSMV